MDAEKRKDILKELAFQPNEWKRPKDIGGFNSSWHSGYLAALVKEGLVERKRVYSGISGGHWEYRLVQK